VIDASSEANGSLVLAALAGFGGSFVEWAAESSCLITLVDTAATSSAGGFSSSFPARVAVLRDVRDVALAEGGAATLADCTGAATSAAGGRAGAGAGVTGRFDASTEGLSGSTEPYEVLRVTSVESTALRAPVIGR
jgi:hypothetical protein